MSDDTVFNEVNNVVDGGSSESALANTSSPHIDNAKEVKDSLKAMRVGGVIRFEVDLANLYYSDKDKTKVDFTSLRTDPAFIDMKKTSTELIICCSIVRSGDGPPGDGDECGKQFRNNTWSSSKSVIC